jgi:hypothetical protein
MLSFYQRWARRLYPLRPLFILLCASGVAAFGWLLFVATVEQTQRWQLSTVLLTVSSLLLWLWAGLFQRDLPLITAEQSFLAKVKTRLIRLCYYALALLVTLLLLATSYLGLRALKGIIAALFFS